MANVFEMYENEWQREEINSIAMAPHQYLSMSFRFKNVVISIACQIGKSWERKQKKNENKTVFVATWTEHIVTKIKHSIDQPIDITTPSAMKFSPLNRLHTTSILLSKNQLIKLMLTI